MRTALKVVFSFLLCFSGVARSNDLCEKPEADSKIHGVHISGSTSGRTVVGEGRAKFYSGPSYKCQMKGVFVIPGDTLHAYIEYKGFTSVIFMNIKTGAEVTGWLESSRLVENEYGISPQK